MSLRQSGCRLAVLLCKGGFLAQFLTRECAHTSRVSHCLGIVQPQEVNMVGSPSSQPALVERRPLSIGVAQLPIVAVLAHFEINALVATKSH